MDMSALQAVRHRLGGSFNDVVLAIVAGAVRRFLLRRQLSVSDLTFRVFVPVSTRTSEQRGALGNRVTGWIVDLPIDEPNARRRLERVSETTAHLKESQAAHGTEIMTEVLDWSGATLLGLAMRVAAQASPFNLVVTNVPGPPVPALLAWRAHARGVSASAALHGPGTWHRPVQQRREALLGLQRGLGRAPGSP
jgi:hypothetical protein